MNIIIAAELSENPTDGLMFRYFTQVVKHQKFDVLIESDKEMIDLYFHYLKRRGMFDYIDDILPRPCKEEGLRIDNQLLYPRTILVKKITFDNVINILGQVGVINRF